MSGKKFFPYLLILVVIGLVAGCAAPAATTGGAAGSAAAGATTAPASSGAASSGAAVTLTWLVDNTEMAQAQAQALADAYTAKNPNVTIKIETRAQGSEGDNIVKTRLATGDMTDIFSYNSGSLLQALHPTETLVDLSQESFVSNMAESFLPSVSQSGQVFGVPFGTGMGGGILYNKKIYDQLGLKVPTTWAEFEANNEKIKAAGITPVIATYGTTWTSQLFVLADYYNVAQAVPNFADDYTAGKIKYATTPAALKGFQYLQEGHDKGWYQKDYATDKYEQGLQLLAEGKGAHYPMLSFALPAIAASFPDAAKDIGFFAQPGDDAAKNGATIWMPGATYIPKTSKNIDEAKKFLGWTTTPEAVDVLNAKVPPSGPYLTKGATLPEDTLPAVKEIAAYIDNNKAGPALEFLSPIKGPSLEQITVAVGTGQMTPEQGAANYDEDVKKQAQQLGLPGW